MIKINLARKKQPAFVEGGSKGSSKLDLTSITKMDLGSLKEFPLRKIVLTLAFVILAGSLIDDYKSDQIEKLDKVIEAIVTKNKESTAKLAKSAGYEKLREQLEKDEFTLRTKVESLKKLRGGRDDSSRSMVALSEGVPQEVWLESYTLKTGDLQIRGFATDYNQISDFMKKLGESTLYSNMELEESSQKKDDKTTLFTFFSIKGNRSVAILGAGGSSGRN